MTGTDWIRSPQAKALLWAALVLSFALGVALVVVDRQQVDGADRTAEPLTDDQAAAQVVGSARQIVAAAHLQEAAGGYTFVSCAHENEAPYQAAFYMSFSLPQADWRRYLAAVASVMIVDGWWTHPHRPSTSAGNSPTAVSPRCSNATLTTHPLRPFGCTASAATSKTTETTTRHGQKSVCDRRVSSTLPPIPKPCALGAR
jgi:hypothetical protein